MKVKLAELLLRRKELQQKVDQLKVVSQANWAKTLVQRKSVSDSVDEIVASVPQVPIEKLTYAYDWHAKRLRLVDALIQQQNWTVEVETEADLMAEFVTPK